jgi:hypothetical protein
MSTYIRLAFLAMAMAWPAIALAQLDQDGPNAILRINDLNASSVDPIDHDITLFVPSTLQIRVSSNANPQQPLIFLLSDQEIVGPTFITPWGGSIDIGTQTTGLPTNVSVIGDGINGSTGTPLDFFMATDGGDPANMIAPTFRFDVSLLATLDGGRVATQFIVADPTTPGNLDNTQAVDMNFEAGQNLLLNPQATGQTPISFLPGKVFNFHGQTFSDIYVSSKGFVSFGASMNYPGANFSNDTPLLTSQAPMISPFAADWDNGSAASAIVYNETGNEVRVAWGDPSVGTGVSHFNGSDQNRFEVVIQLDDGTGSNPRNGEFEIRVIQTDPSATTQNGDGILGHSPGTTLVAAARDIDLHGSNVGLVNEAMIEEHDRTGTNTVSGYDGMGARRAYNNFHNWNATNILFQPTPFAMVPGDAGYVSTAPVAPDDVQGFNQSSLDVAGFEIVTLVGKFAGFNDAAGMGGSVTFDPAGMALQGTILGIKDGTNTLIPALPNTPSSSPFRDGEGLDIVTPDFATAGIAPGPIQVQVDFDSGASFTFTANIAASGQTFTSYPIASKDSNDNFTHALTGTTVDLYGVSYNTIHINQHGYVNLGGPVRNFNESLVDFYQGIPGSGGNVGGPSVAVVWSDMISSGNSAAVFEVTEDSFLNTVKVDFRNQDHWASMNPAGDYSVTFGALGQNSLSFDHTGFIPDPFTGTPLHNVVIGITDGDTAAGADTNFSNGVGTGLSGAIGAGYVTPTGSEPDSFAELIPRGANPMLGIWSALDLGNGLAIPFGAWSLF